MIYLIYVSSATRPMSRADLEAILSSSRRNNLKQGITGMLLYLGGNFMQVIEGPEEAVLALQNRLAQDSRHQGIMVLRQAALKERQFKDWAMGYQNLDSPDTVKPEGYTNFVRDSFLAPDFVKNPSIAHRLLLSFRDTMR